MGYTTNLKAITRVSHYLKDLIEATTNVQWNTPDPRTFAYKIREAINVGYKRYKAGEAQFEHIAKLKSRFILKEYPDRVVAELRDALPMDILSQRMSVLTIPGIDDELGIVGACIEHRGTTILFPDARNISLDMVRSWATTNSYIVNEGEIGVTLRPRAEGET